MSDLLLHPAHEREPQQASFSDEANPLGLDGIEFIEYATQQPQALGQVLQMMGFEPVARHRSREVMLYRHAGLNIVVNAHPGDAQAAGQSGEPAIGAIAVRVRDARAARRYVLDRGGWEVPTHPEAMELNIPAIHGVGGTRIHFVDRYTDFSIYDVDFVPLQPAAAPRAPVLEGVHFFGIVQYIGLDRSPDWIEFYREIFGAALIPDEQRFGIMPAGKLLRAPGRQPQSRFMLQLVEPAIDDPDSRERLHRIGLGVPDVLAAVRVLRERGVEFVESEAAHTERRGAITKTYLGSVLFELVLSEQAAP